MYQIIIILSSAKSTQTVFSGIDNVTGAIGVLVLFSVHVMRVIRFVFRSIAFACGVNVRVNAILQAMTWQLSVRKRDLFASLWGNGKSKRPRYKYISGCVEVVSGK